MGNDSITNLEDWISKLPNPKLDTRPPYVGASKSDIEKAQDDREQEKKYVNIPLATEKAARYILCNAPIIKANLKKDGDWITTVSGRQVFQKKVSDFTGGVHIASMDVNAHLYVEVKSIAPGYDFSLGRLDKANTKGQRTQHEKLTAAMDGGAMVWLFFGVWNSVIGKGPISEDLHGRKRKRWLSSDVYPCYYIIDWSFWLNVILPSLGKRRTLKRKDLAIAEHCIVYNDGRRWLLHDEHWLRELL